MAGTIIALINHKRIRSNCCGVKIETSLDIENTTPPTTLAPITATGLQRQPSIKSLSIKVPPE